MYFEIFKRIYNDDKTAFFKYLEKIILNNGKKFIITANPEIFMYSNNNKDVSKMLLDKNNLIVPDGISIVKSAKYFNVNIKERITGIDISYKLLEYANIYNKSIYLFGAKKEVLELLQKVIKEKYPKIKLLGITDGYVNDKDIVFDKIKKLKPDIVLVALGVPIQEQLIYKHLSSFDKGIFMGVGGSFDVISGYKKRAPKVFIKLNLEWFYRIMCEPKRIKRFYKNNILFIKKIRKESKKINRNN